MDGERRDATWGEEGNSKRMKGNGGKGRGGDEKDMFKTGEKSKEVQ